jgi:hypothetical protein
MEKNDNDTTQKIECNGKIENYLKLARDAYKGKGKR